ncbi:MAG: peptide-methionine (S)-S-oxide reductase MsrA [Gaiellaceae bacterium]
MSVTLARPPALDRRDRLIGVATFAAGCFWGVERAFRELPGVIETTVGYTGGADRGPTYERVATGTTGHVEAVRVEFDPSRVSYEELLERFWQLHDPTRSRLGRRSRYRSAIFVHSREQEQAARDALDALAAASDRPVLTEIRRAPLFYRAEERHQRYLERR